MRKLRFYLSIVAVLSTSLSVNAGVLIDKVNTSEPTADGVYTISWNLLEPVIASVFITDLQGRIIKTLVNNEAREAVGQSVIWYGVDEYDQPAPSGLYVPIIRAKSKTKGVDTYNPTSIPWGEEVIPAEIFYSSDEQVLSYTLDKRAYCRLRVGETDGGPLYATVAGWKLRVPGTYEESWTGLDSSGIVRPAEKATFRISLDAFTVPENSLVISQAAEVKDGEVSERKYRHFPVHPPHGGQIAFYPSLPNGLQPDLGISTGFAEGTEEKDGRYILRGEATVEVELASGIIDDNPAETKELMLFMEGKLVREDKIDSLPASMTFDTTEMKKGNHILTINLRTSGDRAASSSMNIFITK